MDSGEESLRPSARRRMTQAEEDSDDDMLGNGQNRFGNGAEEDEGQGNGQQQADLPPYETCRVDPDPFVKDAEPLIVSDLRSAKELMDSFQTLLDPDHYTCEGYSGLIAKVFALQVTESHPDHRDIVDAVFREVHEGSAESVAERIKNVARYTDCLLLAVRAILMPNRSHPDVTDGYEMNMQLLDSYRNMIIMHKLSLLSAIAQKTGNLQIMADATITMKPYEELKDQVKLQKHLFSIFESQQNRVYADKVMRQIVVPVLLPSGSQADFKTRSWGVLYRDPMGGRSGSRSGTTELDVETWVNDNLDTDNDLILEWSATSSEKHSAREALRVNHKVSIAAAQRHYFSFAHGDTALIYDIRADKTYPMGNGLPEHMMVGGFHARPFDLYEQNRDGGFWDGNWFAIPTALDQVCL